jgi:hypothetical protein
MLLKNSDAFAWLLYLVIDCSVKTRYSFFFLNIPVVVCTSPCMSTFLVGKGASPLVSTLRSEVAVVLTALKGSPKNSAPVSWLFRMLGFKDPNIDGGRFDVVTRSSGRRGLGEPFETDFAVLSLPPRGMSGCSRAFPTEFLFLCFISFFSVRGELEAPSGSLEEWVKVDRAKRPDFLLPQEPYALSLLLLDMASDHGAHSQQQQQQLAGATVGNTLSRGWCRAMVDGYR